MESFPTVTLAGQPYPVKPLVLRQIRVVQPMMQKLGRINPKAITEEDFDLLIDIVHLGIAPAQDNLTRDDLLNLPIRFAELAAAIDVIASQAGMETKPKESATGEAPAGS